MPSKSKRLYMWCNLLFFCVNREMHEARPSLMRVPDLCYLIYDICDDATLLRLSMTCKFNRRQLLGETNQERKGLMLVSSRAQSKGYVVRILEYKYRAAAKKLDLI